MPIPTPGVLAAPTVDELGVELQQSIPASKHDAAQSACSDAMVCALSYLGQVDDPETLGANGIAVVRKVAKRIAVRFFTNPQDRASYSGPDGLSYTMSPNVSARILTQDERDQLDFVKPVGFGA